MSEFRSGFRETVQRIMSDREARTVLIGAVLLYSFFYPAPYRRQVPARLPVAVVDLDLSPMSRELVRSTLAVRAVNVVELGTSFAAARASLEQAKVQAILVILISVVLIPFGLWAFGRAERWREGGDATAAARAFQRCMEVAPMGTDCVEENILHHIGIGECAKVEELADAVERIVVPEMNLGQFALEVERVAGRKKVVRVNRANGEMVTPDMIVSAVEA